MQMFVETVSEFVSVAWNCKNQNAFDLWQMRVCAFLRSATDDKVAESFMSVVKGKSPWEWQEKREMQIGHLQGLALRIESDGLSSQTKQPQPSEVTRGMHPISKDVFVVHGHDAEVKESVARFIERLGLSPIILHEQPNSGKTIIEKFETFSDVGFAVVLLTPDDIGASADAKDKMQGRARQNVILELGYFTGKLGRHRVCPLYKSGVEIPSDFQGVIYTPIDAAGAWKTKLAQELVEAGFSIDLNALLKG